MHEKQMAEEQHSEQQSLEMTHNDNEQQPAHRRVVRSFVRRTGRMTAAQQRGFDECWEKFGLKLEDGAIEPAEVFGNDAPVVLEIGFGMGHSLAEMAGNALDKNYIGVEVHSPGVGSLLNEVHEAGLNNVRVYCDDAVEVLKQCVPEQSLDRVQIYFPDPWHKKRHHKRRLVKPEFLELLAKHMKVGGHIHLATDWEHYAEQMLEVLSESPLFRNTAEKDYVPRPDYRPLTKFEKRGHRLGHGVWDLVFERI
ncbi:tRNA (guanosine(46)-N7)-methyltransferase TrmB [Endozoicomonadaceae bacterium StTr2]